MFTVLCLVTQLCPTPCNLVNYSPPGSSVHGVSPGKNTGVSCHALLQGIFPTQGSNPGLPHCKQIFTAEPPGKPRKTIALTIGTFVSQVRSLLFNTLSRFVIAFLSRSKYLNFMATVTIHSDFGAQENKICHCFHFFPIYSP